MTEKRKESEKKTTSEKPVSLHPLDFDEALKALLVTPPPEQKRKPKKRKNESENKPA